MANKDLLAKRITDLQKLHEDLNNVLMESLKIDNPQISVELGVASGTSEIIRSAMQALKNEIDALRKHLN